MTWLRPRTWWQAGLLWGTVMFVYYLVEDGIDGKLTIARAAKDFLVWESGGLVFGLVLTAVLSLLSHKNLFRGWPDRGGKR